MEAHEKRVEAVTAQVEAFYRTKTPFRVYHGNTNATRPSIRSQANSLDVSALNSVLSIDTKRKVCIVEPNVSMDMLVDVTLTHDLVPPIVPEFPGITVGGAFAGTAGESSSFRHGYFDACVNWCDIVLADGKFVRASATENSDLFEGCKGAFGTLGIGVLFEVRLIEATRYVELSYLPVSGGIKEAQAVIKEESAKPAGQVDFLDGIMFDRHCGVILSGKMINSNEDGLAVAGFDKPWDQWFYVHAENVLKQSSKHKNSSTDSKHSTPHRELIALKNYFFRFDRGAFWMGRHAFSYFLTPFNRITRFVLNIFMHTRTMYHALHRSGMNQTFLIQDMALPWASAARFFEWVDTELDIYPQWLCPLRADDSGGGFNPHLRQNGDAEKQDLILNFGVWGPCPGDTVVENRQLEAILRRLGGMKWLYAQTFYTEEEFWAVYDRKSYEALRVKYNAESLPNVYDKVGASGKNQPHLLTGIWATWPIAGIYGVLSTLKGGDYLRKV